MQVIRAGLIVLMAGCLCPAFSLQSAEKSEAKPTQAAPNSKDGSSSQKPAIDASQATGDVEILSDTMGFDFGPYLKRVTYAIKDHWYQLVPESARAPMMKQGKVAIAFTIMKDGKIAGLKLVSSSGDISLDRAAWGGITDSGPFPPLPAGFKGWFLQLRVKFFYNPEKTEGSAATPPADKSAPAEKSPRP